MADDWWRRPVDETARPITLKELDDCIEQMHRQEQEYAEAVRRWAYGFGEHPDGFIARRRPRVVDTTET